MRKLCLLLAIVLCLSLLSATVFGSDGEQTGAPNDLEAANAVTDTGETPDSVQPSEDVKAPKPYDEVHKAYIDGNPDGTFRPEQTLSRAEMAQILYNLGSYQNGPAAFPDVPDGKWYTAAINALARAGILKGYDDGKFRPLNPVTRAEFVTVLYRLAGEPDAALSNFPDVSPKSWAAKAIGYAEAKGWISGYDDHTFRPENPINRAEAVKVINRYLNRIPDKQAIDNQTNIRFYPDVLKSAWFYYEVMEASVTHNAHYNDIGAAESGSNYIADKPHLQNGFYFIKGNMYVCENGCLVHTAKSGKMNGISYTCTGENGICQVKTILVETWDGKLVWLENYVPKGKPGEYQEGFYLFGHHIYAVQDGCFVNTAGTYHLNGYSFTCE